MSRRASALAVLVVAAVYASVGPSLAYAAALGVIAALALLLPWRTALDRVSEVLLSVIVGAVALAVLVFAFQSRLGPPHALRASWAAFAGAALLLAVSRLWLRRPLGGQLTTLAIALSALAACGGKKAGLAYPAALVGFGIAALVARRAQDRARAPLRGWTARQVLFACLGLAVAGGITSTAAVGMPVAHDWTIGQLMHLARGRMRTGFSDRLWLGSLRLTLLSDDVVLRVRGARADYLRGLVYTRYAGGRWTRGEKDAARPTTLPRTLPAGANVTALEFVESEPEHFFVPLGVGQVAVASGAAAVDRAGIVAPLAAFPADRLWFRRGPQGRLPLAPATSEDLQLQESLAARLRPLAQRWTAGASGTAARLERLEQRLQSDEFRYSLEFERRGREPVLQFLLHDRQGHCEYFASAMALLSRSIGVPARVVGGYRVTERSDLGGYFIVRERNAHTWVEAWIEGEGWRRYDPTPPSELAAAMPARTPFGAALVDLLRSAWSRALSWLDERTIGELLAPLVALLMAVLGIRWWRARRARRAVAQRPAAERPLPCFERLCSALARHGIRRQRSETVERLARRLAATKLPKALASEGAQLLRRYAGLRYGELGDADELSRRMDRFAQRLAHAARASSSSP